MNKKILYAIVLIFDISYAMVFFIIYAYIVGRYNNFLFERLFGDINQKNNKILIMFEITAQFIAVGLLSLFGRYIFQIIPFSFDKFFGFKRTLLNKLFNGSFLTIFLIMFQTNIQNKINYIKKIDSNKYNSEENYNIF